MLLVLLLSVLLGGEGLQQVILLRLVLLLLWQGERVVGTNGQRLRTWWCDGQQPPVSFSKHHRLERVRVDWGSGRTKCTAW